MNALRCPLGWIKRRARRLQAFFKIDRAAAVVCAADDWRGFVGQALPAPNASEPRQVVRRVTRSCDHLGVCQLHATGRPGCDACPYRHLPRNVPPFAPGVIDGPTRRKGWRAALRPYFDWLLGDSAW